MKFCDSELRNLPFQYAKRKVQELEDDYEDEEREDSEKSVKKRMKYKKVGIQFRF